MSDIKAELLDALQAIHTRGSGNFVIVASGDYYVQIAADRGAGLGDLEAVSNNFLPPEHQIGPSQQSRLADLGFSEPGETNWHQKADVSSPDARKQTAKLMIDTLKRVFGVDPSGASIELVLDAW